MAERVARAAADSGADAEGVEHVLRAYVEAMRPREASGLPEDDPDFLRPGRTVLILVEDVKEQDARVLAVGAMAESRRDDLRLGAEEAALVLASGENPGEALAWWRALPALGWKGVHFVGRADGRSDESEIGGHDDRLLEDLVIAPLPVQRVALAEGLDQIRHAHLWSSASDRLRAAVLARRVLHPLAARVDGVLERRYEWWLRRVGSTFERRAQEGLRGRAPSGA
jgi:hypothetical protein